MYISPEFCIDDLFTTVYIISKADTPESCYLKGYDEETNIVTWTSKRPKAKEFNSHASAELVVALCKRSCLIIEEEVFG
jgi:hypothetical protein